MNYNPKILCTIGPSSLNERTLKKMEKEDVWLLRINLSHTKIDELENVISIIRKYCNIPISLDSEGAQVRTGYLKQGKVFLAEWEKFYIRKNIDHCFNNDIILNYPEIIDKIKIGELIFLDFNSATIQVVEKHGEDLFCKVLVPGSVGTNKAVSFQRDVELPSLTEKDIQAIRVGKKMGIKHYALSFAQNQKTVSEFRKLIGEESFLISKVESNYGLQNLKDIIKNSDAILIDRGDLSRDQDVSKIPFWQKTIINEVKLNKKEVYIATNLLETMVEKKLPTRAEVNDIASILIEGGSGLVLAAETAIGHDPIATIRILKNVIHQYEEYKNGNFAHTDNLDYNLINPIGGHLTLAPIIESQEEINSLGKQIHINFNQYLDFLEISEGGFSPLEGFMGSESITHVLEKSMLSGSNIIWPIPIILQIDHKTFKLIDINEDVSIYYNNKIIGSIKIEEKFELNLDTYCQKLFNTNQVDHPGVALVNSMGKYVVSGKIKKIKDISFNPSKHELSPFQTRKIFTINGWKQIVGFHGRNVPHNGHVFIQKYAYKNIQADGLFINPVSSKLRDTDFDIEDIINSYTTLGRESIYDGYNFLVASLAYYPRFAGPREALFTALIRQNYGCSHFIIGRDHTGVGDYYSPEMFQEYLNNFISKIDIEIIFADEAYFCKGCNAVTIRCEHEVEKHIKISGTKVRNMLSKSDQVDFRIVNEAVINLLKTVEK
ncbi:MAG: pyruvate kinase [Bacteroidetes bacterium]|nr:pyruvate kinase [Bacteroidota bacterium]